jgi:lipoprotein-anchoring transpeptidase ErfK/SrfK
MWIEWRKFTNDHWRFGYPLLFWTLCLGSLLILALLNYIAIGGQDRRTKQQVEEKPQVDQSSLSKRNASEPTVAIPNESRAAVLTAPREAGFPHIKVDLGRQMLSVVDASGNVLKVLPVSTGSGRWYISEGERRRAVTPRGRFTVYRKIAGWRKSPLGLMYYPVYIVGGIAIHGSPSVPRSPASHGCIRIPMYAAKAFYDSTPVGTPVLVY